MDKLFKVWLKDGKETWLLIHIEVQGRREAFFEERMFVYRYRIFERHPRRSVVSLAMLCDDDPNWKPNHFVYNDWGCELSFRFLVVKLLDLRGKEEELEQDNNPFAAVVLSQLKALETKHAPQQRQLWKLRLIKGLYRRRIRRERNPPTFSGHRLVAGLAEGTGRRNA